MRQNISKSEFDRNSSENARTLLLVDDEENVRVVIIDDNDSSRDLLAQVLQSWGMIVVSAKREDHVIDLLQQTAGRGIDCQLILLNMEMQDTVGVQLAQTIKADPALHAIQMTLITPFGYPLDHEIALKLGVATQVQKPVRIAQLYKGIVTALEAGMHEQEHVASTDVTVHEKVKTSTRETPSDGTELQNRTSPVLDRNLFTEYRQFMGDEFKDVVDAFFKNTSCLLPILRKAATQANREILIETIYKLRRSSSLGAKRLPILCEVLLDKCYAGLLLDASQQITNIEDEYESQRQTLAEMMATTEMTG